jgi:peptidoglycan hydrolase-like protein with peptidoglycan-binding domain
MTFNKFLGGGLLALVLTAGAGSVAQAQVIAQPVSAGACLSLAYNMRIGSTDASTQGSVTALQNFLVSQGYFNSAYVGSGRFGPITFAAVARFQASQGVSAIGVVGPLTRAAIARVSCGTVIPPQTNVSIYNINPSSSAIGTTVSVTGFGFTSDNTILMDGSIAVRGVPITSSIAIACTTNPTCHGGINQTIQFAIPQYLSPNCPIGSMCPLYMRQVTPGQYNITVQNSNGTSNSAVLTVTSNSTNQPLSINGLDAPTTLALGTQGTWTVHVLAGSGTGTLHYSVVWGDEASAGTASIVAPQQTSTQTSATFTHAYQHSGSFTPIFMVTDDSGHTVSASNTIVVTPLY